MKRASGKSNIDIVKDYMAGVRPFTQVGYNGDVNKYRKEGEKWTDNDGIEWQKTDGKVVKITKSQGDMIREMIRQKCKCGQVISWGTKLDQKLFNRTGLCSNCLITYETNLRILGIYPDYESYKMLSYELGSIQEAKVQIEEIIKYFTEENGDMTMICNGEGYMERWQNTNKEQILKDAKKDLKIARKRIKQLAEAKEAAKKRYQEGAAKYKMEIYV